MFHKLLAALGLLCAGPAAAAPPGEEPPEVRYAAMLEREYGPLGTTTAQILGRADTHEPVTVVGALVYRLRAKPAERLSLVEKKLLAVYALKEEVDAGGFAQYFNAPAGDGAALALQALREMQAMQIVKPVQRALGVFASSRPPADPARRAQAVAALPRRAGDIWSACEQEFYLREDGLAELALAFARRHRAQITLP